MKLKRILLISLTLFVTSYAYASDDDLQLTVCAALRPCNGEGGVLPEFRGGACEPIYADQCSHITTMSTVTKAERRYAQCKISGRKKDLEIRHLKKQLRAALRAKHSLAQ